MVEGGVIGPTWKPGELPISTNEMRAAYRAQMLPGITDAHVEIVWDPPWNKGRMSDAAKLQLGML